MISVLLPSRGRPAMLSEAICSLFDLASNPRNIEILVACDPDDLRTADEAAVHGVECWVTPERYGYARLWEYTEGLAYRSSGSFLMLGNDDAVMTTKAWDDRIYEMPENIMVGNPRHNLTADGWNCFPVMRRVLYETLGHYSGSTCHIDSYIEGVVRPLGLEAPLDIYIDHRRPDITGGPIDATFLEGRSGLAHHAFFDQSGPTQAGIRADIEKVRTCLL